jgi:NAD(P)-dependent dehydrogenase (short-subunit alcohol dehydrogenase family)
VQQLKGRTALVTGASGGLGTHIARGLAREGMNVVVSGRREDVLSAVAAELCGLGVNAQVVPADLSDLSQIDSLIERSEAELGSIDLLVNNAGVEPSWRRRALPTACWARRPPRRSQTGSSRQSDATCRR